MLGRREREGLWRELRFTPFTLDDPGIERLIAALRGIHTNWVIIDRGLRRLAMVCVTASD